MIGDKDPTEQYLQGVLCINTMCNQLSTQMKTIKFSSLNDMTYDEWVNGQWLDVNIDYMNENSPSYYNLTVAFNDSAGYTDNGSGDISQIDLNVYPYTKDCMHVLNDIQIDQIDSMYRSKKDETVAAISETILGEITGLVVGATKLVGVGYVLEGGSFLVDTHNRNIEIDIHNANLDDLKSAIQLETITSVFQIGAIVSNQDGRVSLDSIHIDMNRLEAVLEYYDTEFNEPWTLDVEEAIDDIVTAIETGALANGFGSFVRWVKEGNNSNSLENSIY